MATKLGVYNNALLYCGEAALAILEEESEPRRLLDTVWDNQGVNRCLEEGEWKFATRAAKLDSDPTQETEDGYRYVFQIPSDFVTSVQISNDEYHRVPLLDFVNESGYLFAEIDPIYLRWVSDGLEHGMNLSVWPPSFADYVSAYLASKICNRITSDKDIRRQVVEILRSCKYDAVSSNAKLDPTKFPPPGSWNVSRGSRNSQSRSLRGIIGGT